jgi:hypothetical protein
MLQDLKRDILAGKRTIADAITAALPLFRGKLNEHKVAFLVNEYQGYQNIALDWYKRPSKEFPNYRIIEGQMKMMDTNDGSVSDVTHPMTANKQFFISAPISWVEESLGLGIDPTMVEMSEMGRMPNGILVCITAKANVQRIIDIVKQSLLSFIDEADM